MFRTTVLCLVVAASSLLAVAPAAQACTGTTPTTQLVCNVVNLEYVGGAVAMEDCMVNQSPPADWTSDCVLPYVGLLVDLFVATPLAIALCMVGEEPPLEWVDCLDGS